MSEQTIAITLPDSVFNRIKEIANVSSLTSEEVIRQSIMLLLPAFESDISQELRLSLASLSLLNDIQLWKVAKSAMRRKKQLRLENLAELKKHRSLTQIEQAELDSLMNEAQQTMLCKAEAKRLLSQRGHVIFASEK